METGIRKMRQHSKRNKGVALISALIVVSIAAGIFAAVMYFTLSSTEISSIQRKYQNSKEASIGAIDIMTKDILPRVITGANLSSAITGLGGSDIIPVVKAESAKDACFLAKLTSATSSWPGGTCDSNPDPTINSDIVFHLKTTSTSNKPYVVNLKIVDTVTGNSDRSGTVLEAGSGVVDDASAIIKVQHFPYLYTMMSDSRPQNSTTERANIEVLYAY